jgi:hypothetical protein
MGKQRSTAGAAARPQLSAATTEVHAQNAAMGKAVGNSSAALARELPWWPAFELRVRHGWSAPPAAACAVAQAPGPVPSARTLYRFAARIFPKWIRAKGIKLADVQIAWLRRRHLIPSWY